MSIEALPYGKVLKTPEEVNDRIAEMATDAVLRYRGKKVLFVTLLNGGVPFADKLMEEIAQQDPNFHPDQQYIRISRYGDKQTTDQGTETEEEKQERLEAESKRIWLDLKSQKKAAASDTVVLVDDLIDEGGTFVLAYEEMVSYGAQSVEALVLGRKKKVEEVDMLIGKVSIEGVGFDNLPDVWLTGMGMDDSSVAPEANRFYGGIAVATTQLPGLSDEIVDERVAAYEQSQIAA